MNQLKYEKVCRTVAILIMILGLLMGARYFWEVFEMIVDYGMNYTFAEIFRGWYDKIFQMMMELLGISLLLAFRKKGLPVILGVCAIVIAVECAIDSYILLVEYKQAFDPNPTDFFNGAISLVIAVMLFFNGILYAIGAAKSAALIKYATIAMIIIQILAVIIELRGGYDLEVILLMREYDVPSYLLLILVLFMSTSKYAKQASFMGMVTTSVRDLRNSMMSEGVGIDRGIALRFSEYNKNGLWCNSYSFILTTFNLGRYSMSIAPVDGNTVCRVASTYNGSGMNIFRFNLTGVWFDTGDASTCDVMRFYGTEGLFIQLIVRDSYEFRPQGIPKLGAAKLTSREEGTTTHAIRVKVSAAVRFLARHLTRFIRFVKANTVGRIKKKKEE